MQYEKTEAIAQLSLGEIACLNSILRGWGEENEYSFFKPFV